MLAEDENIRLIKRLQSAGEHTPAAKEILTELWERNIRLVRFIIRRVVGKLEADFFDFEDLEQQAFFYFYTGVFEFDCNGEITFSAHIGNRIKWGLIRYLDNYSGAAYIPVHIRDRMRKGKKKQEQLEKETGQSVSIREALEATGLSCAAVTSTLCAYKKSMAQSIEASTTDDSDGRSLLDILAGDTDLEADAITPIWQQELHDLLINALLQIPEKESAVLYRHYFEDVSINQISKEIGLTRQGAYRLANAGLKKMRIGKYAVALADFMPTTYRKARAYSTIVREKKAVERLQLTNEERGILVL